MTAQKTAARETNLRAAKKNVFFIDFAGMSVLC